MLSQTTAGNPVSSVTARRLLEVISNRNSTELSRALCTSWSSPVWNRSLTSREIEALDTLQQVRARLQTLLPTLAAERQWDTPEMDGPVTILKSLAG